MYLRSGPPTADAGQLPEPSTMRRHRGRPIGSPGRLVVLADLRRCWPRPRRGQRRIPGRVQHPLPGERAPPHLRRGQLRAPGLRGRRSDLAVRLRALGDRGLLRGAHPGQRELLPPDRRRGDDRAVPGDHPDRGRRLHLAAVRRGDHRQAGRRLLSGPERRHAGARGHRRRERLLRRRLARRRQDLRRSPLYTSTRADHRRWSSRSPRRA